MTNPLGRSTVPSNETEPPSVAVAATVAAVLVALASSLWQMTRKPLWIDEAFSLGATNQLVDTITGSAGTMAAYYVVLDGWTAVFGTTRMDLRSLSLVLCLLALVLLAVLARRVLHPVEASAAVLVTAALPGLVRMAQDARAYPLALVLAAAGWLVVSRLVESEAQGPGSRAGWAWGLALVPVAAIGVLAQGLFTLQLAAMGLSVLAHPRRRALAMRLVPAAASGLGTLGLLWSVGAHDVADWIPPLALSQARPFVGTLLGYEGSAMVVLGFLAVGGALVLARRRDGSPEERWAALLPIWWGLVPAVLLLLLSTTRPSFLGRYVLPSLPGVGMLVAVGAVRAWSASTSWLSEPDHRGRVARGVRVVTAVGVIVVLALALAGGRVSRTRGGYEEWDRAAELVATEARSGDGLVFSFASGTVQAVEDTGRAPFEAAWREVDPRAVPVALSPARPLGQVRRFDDLTPVPELGRRMLAHARVWVVQFSGFEASLRDLLATAVVARSFRRVRTHTFGGGVQVVLLERV